MTPPKSPPQPAVSVEKCDRDAAAAYARQQAPWQDGMWDRAYKTGEFDTGYLVQMLARHRASAAPPADCVLRPRDGDRELYEMLSTKLARVHPSNQRADLPMMIKATYGQIARLRTAMLSAAPKAPTAPIGEAARPGREEIAEAVGSLLDDKVHAEARRLHLADATQSGYEHHLIRVAGEMALSALFDGASA